MTVKNLIEILEKLPDDNIILWRDDIKSKGWTNIEIDITDNEVFILPDKKPLFND